MQAVCTEFLITFCDVLFCAELPRFASHHNNNIIISYNHIISYHRFASLNFDLGIEIFGDGDDVNEVDIDGAIQRAEKNAENEVINPFLDYLHAGSLRELPDIMSAKFLDS